MYYVYIYIYMCVCVCVCVCVSRMLLLTLSFPSTATHTQGKHAPVSQSRYFSQEHTKELFTLGPAHCRYVVLCVCFSVSLLLPLSLALTPFPLTHLLTHSLTHSLQHRARQAVVCGGREGADAA